MAEIEISREARIDLDDIRISGVERFGADFAERHLLGIRQSFEVLAAHPYAGQERPELGRGIRSIPRRPHVVLYLVRDDVVLIVRVLHQARDVAAALRGGS